MNTVWVKVYFVSQDGNNTVYEKNNLSKVRHPEYTPHYPDLTIYCLDDDLPLDTIKPCKVLPSDWLNFIQKTPTGLAPALCLDQEEKALITDVRYIFDEYATREEAKHWFESVNITPNPIYSQQTEHFRDILHLYNP